MAELRGYMGGLYFDDHQRSTMIMILEGVQASLESYLNRTVEPTRIRERVPADHRGFLQLSNTPVHSILSVNLEPNNVESSFQEIVERLDPADERLFNTPLEVANQYDRFPVSVSPHNILVPGGAMAVPYQLHYVDYIGGLSGQNISGMKLAIIRVAAREYASNLVETSGNRSGSPEQTEVGDARFLGWSDDELKAFARYRRRVAVI